MQEEAIISKWWIRWSLSAGAWTLLGVLFASQVYMDYSYAGHAITWSGAFAVALAQWYLWAGLAVFILWLTRRFPLERRRWLRHLLLYLVVGVFIAMLKTALDTFTLRGFVRMGLVPTVLSSPLMVYFNLLTYGAIVGVGNALTYYRKYRERERRAAQLETQLAQAQLQALKMQLHPHFLFNTLHTIGMLNHTDVEKANRVLVLLSDLLRLTLDGVGRQEVTLKQELDFLERYLEIEQVRFEDRLRVHLNIDPQTLDANVPNLILQPLVENAIRHGISKRAAAGRLDIQAWRANGKLHLQVVDDGPGLPQGSLELGIGLRNTMARLTQLYGASHVFRLEPGSNGGVVVTLILPFRTDAAL